MRGDYKNKNMEKCNLYEKHSNKIECFFLKIKQSTPNMNIVIQKLKLPCDIKYVIKTFCYNDLGYNAEQIMTIEHEKEKRKNAVLRFSIEAIQFKKMNMPISWLKKLTKNNGTGVYSPGSKYELRGMEYLYLENYITKEQYLRMLTYIHDSICENDTALFMNTAVSMKLYIKFLYKKTL